MTVYQGGYECPKCGPVEAKLSWSDDENDTVAYCKECGAKLQRVIPVSFSKASHLGLGGLGRASSNSGVSPETPIPTPTEEAEK